MDPILALIIIEQTIATVIIAGAIVIYSRATTRILEAHVEPEVHVAVEGGPQSNALVIANSAGCAIANLSVIISAGCVWGTQPYPARHCIYFGAWEAIPNKETDRTVHQPLKAEAFANAQLPEGAQLDLNDISVEYSFTRRADNRRYAFKYQLGIFKQPDDQLVYVRIEEPQELRVTKCVTGGTKARKPVAFVPNATSPTDAALLPLDGPMLSAETSESASLAFTAVSPCIG